jgi:hypothetical protein
MKYKMRRQVEEADMDRKPCRPRKINKPWRLECRWKKERPGILHRFWKDWTRHGSYETEQRARQAARDSAKGALWQDMNFRIVNTKTKQVIEL